MNNTTNELKTKVCNKCKRALPADIKHFNRNKNFEDGLNLRCKECRGTTFGIHEINRVLKTEKGFKYCSSCRRKLPADFNHFHRQKGGVDGLRSACKECRGGKFGVHAMGVVYTPKIGYKFCSTCKEQFLFSEFNKQKSHRDGYSSSCRKCDNQKNNEYYSKPENKIKKSEYDKKYYLKPENKERMKAYNRKHNKEYNSRPEVKIKKREYQRKYYATEEGKVLRAKRKNDRRSRKANAIYNYPTGTWEETLDFFGHECAYCGKYERKLQQEHVIPVVNSGNFTRQNIIPACSYCNQSKGGKNLLDWYPTKEYFSEKRLRKINKWAGINEKSHSQQLSIF